MVREFKLPDVGEGVHEGELVSWLVEEGDAVSEDQPVAEVETDKALVEVPAPVDGTVRELRYEAGDVIPVGEVFVTFDVEGEAPRASEAESGKAASQGEATEAPEVEPDLAGDPGAETAKASGAEGRVFAPPSVRRLAREEGVDLSRVHGSGPGGRIAAGDVRAAAADEPGGGGAGTEATETADTGAESSDSGAAATTAAAESPPPADAESADREKTLAAPATRRLAREAGVDLDAVPATDEREGEAFVTPEAVREYADVQQNAQRADAAALTAGAAGEAGSEAGTEFAAGERERREPFRGVRKRIAEAMERSAYTAPHVTHHDEADVTRLVEIREELKPRAAEQGISLTYLPFVAKAVLAALSAFPEMNAVIDDETDEIVYRDYNNLGVATATDVGLMVPVIEDADRKGLLQLASETNELVQKARDRTIGPDELRGSTFTITNVGAIGGEYATPILNYPETGILAMGEIKRKPRVVTDGDGAESIEPRSVLTLSLSFDHRLIDGAVGARFTNAVIERLENPELLLLE